jgi:hypothetical protein
MEIPKLCILATGSIKEVKNRIRKLKKFQIKSFLAKLKFKYKTRISYVFDLINKFINSAYSTYF